MQERVTIGVVGTGFGQQVHVPAFRRSPRCAVQAICASHQERAEAAARTLGIPMASSDWRELVADPDLDALALAVPPAIQAEIALAAARAGKHLFCEKPLGLNAGQARDIAVAARESKIAHAVDFIFPELPAWQKTRDLVQSSFPGPIRHVALTWRLETYSYRAATDNWKTSAASGGGTLNNFASHTFYYLEWLFGRIIKVAACLSPRLAEVEARVDAWVEFAAGFTGNISIAADAFLGPGHRLEVYGDSGTIVLENAGMDYARGFRLSVGTRETPRLAPLAIAAEDDSTDGRIYPVSRIASRFIDAILNTGEVSPGLREGLRVQVLLDALRLADRDGAWQDVGSA